MTTETQIKHAETFKRALQDGDFMLLWNIWAEVAPGMPGPKTPQQAEIVMHRARSESSSVSNKGRCYSHKWLEERGIESGLPEHLKPMVDQYYPKVAAAVGISVNMPRIFSEVANEVEKAMSDAVEELAADGADLDDRKLVHGLMFERRERVMQSMVGRKSIKGIK